MTTNRLLELISLATTAREHLTAPRTITVSRKKLKAEYANGMVNGIAIETLPARERAMCWEDTREVSQRIEPARGSIRRNDLPKVSFEEHHWLCTHENEGIRKIAQFTRCFDYDDSVYVENVDLPVQAKKPTIREIWVGSRSMACVGEDEVPEGHMHSQAEQEDAAELTDMCTLTYDDAFGFDRWYVRTVSNACRAAGRKPNDFKWRAHFQKAIEPLFMRDREGNPIKCMLTDDNTGEYRPVRINDVISVAHGSNENLNALFLDEPGDPRGDDINIIRELTRQRINPNSYADDTRLYDKERRRTREFHTGTKEPVFITLSEAVRGSDEDEVFHNDIYLMKVAAYQASEIVEANPDLDEHFLALREHAFAKLKAMHGPFRKDAEGDVVSGRWIGPKDYWDMMEDNIRHLEKHLANKRRVAPQPVDWKTIKAG